MTIGSGGDEKTRWAREAAKLHAEVGARVAMYRLRVGLTQTELAKTAGLSRFTVGQLERGKQNVTLEVLLRVSVALGVKLRDLF